MTQAATCMFSLAGVYGGGNAEKPQQTWARVMALPLAFCTDTGAREAVGANGMVSDRKI